MVCIWWVTKDLEVEEGFIGFVPLEWAPTVVIATIIKDVLMRLSLPVSNAKAQCYDGCSTMVGSKKSLATIIKQFQPNCLLIIVMDWMRNEQDATSFYEMVKIRADQLSLEKPSLQKKRKVPNRMSFLHFLRVSFSPSWKQ